MATTSTPSRKGMPGSERSGFSFMAVSSEFVVKISK
jgi:hypothetical protein